MTNRHLPPGQALTRKFPVVGEQRPAPAALDLEGWQLEVEGLVERPLHLTWNDYLELPKSERRLDLHCVTGWSRLATTVTGVPLSLLLDHAQVAGSARFVRFEAYSDRGHDTSLPLALTRADSWLVHAVDGAPLSVEHGFPLRMVTPSRYFYKSLKWVRKIELLADDRLGFWERESAYHNSGDPWAGDQRFTTGSIDPAELVRLRAGVDLSPWRLPRRVVLGADLRQWHPADRDLRRLQLKNCDLRAARLAGCDLRGANLSLSDLRGADLTGADADGADLEGANLIGALLTGASLRGAALSATRFAGDAHRTSAADPAATTLAGLRIDGATGLLEAQEEYLRRHGVSA